MNFDLTDDQRAIKRTANEFLASRYKPEVMRELAEGERGFTDEGWRELSELGWPGVMIPEGDGGLGLGAVELLVIQEEMGYALAPSPLFSTVSAALLLAAAGTSEQRERWLGPLAQGEARGTIAVWDERSGWAPDRSEIETENGTMSATKVAVPDASGADFLIISGADGAHFLVETSSPGVSVVATKALDPTRKLFTVHLDRVGQRAMEMTVAYAKDRKQFDRPIGSYQAVSHRCAQMLLEVEGARSLSYWAGWALDHEPSTAPRAASMAKAYAGDAGFRVAASALQVHGGIGFTWEHDLHFFLKRAKANAHAFGDSRWHRDRVAELAGVTAASAPAGSPALSTLARSPAPAG